MHQFKFRDKRGRTGGKFLTLHATCTSYDFQEGYFEEDVLFAYDTLKRRSHFYEDVADSIHMLQRRSGFHAIFTKT